MWLALILGLLQASASLRLSPFDPAQQLISRSMDVNFEAELSRALQSRLGPLNNTLVHVRSGRCFCETLAARHSSKISQDFGRRGYRNIELQLTEDDQLLAFFPSSPALVVFNQAQQLIYLGPYAEGLGCISNDNSLIEQIVRLSSAQYGGPMINAEPEGCYCAL